MRGQVRAHIQRCSGRPPRDNYALYCSRHTSCIENANIPSIRDDKQFPTHCIKDNSGQSGDEARLGVRKAPYINLTPIDSYLFCHCLASVLRR